MIMMGVKCSEIHEVDFILMISQDFKVVLFLCLKPPAVRAGNREMFPKKCRGLSSTHYGST